MLHRKKNKPLGVFDPFVLRMFGFNIKVFFKVVEK